MEFTWKHALVLAGIAGLAFLVHEDAAQARIREALVKRINVDIPESMIEDATRKAVRDAAKHAADLCVGDISCEVSSRVRTAVNSEYNDLAAKVSSSVFDAATKIDENDLREKLIKLANKKLEEKSDDIVHALKNKIEDIDVSDVIEAVAKNQKSNVTIKLF